MTGSGKVENEQELGTLSRLLESFLVALAIFEVEMRPLFDSCPPTHVRSVESGKVHIRNELAE